MRALLLAALLSVAPLALSAQEVADTLAAGRPDTLITPDAERPPPDSAAAAPLDTTLQKLRERTPLFPEDIDPYTPLGSGRPELILERDDLRGWPGATAAELLPRLYPLAVDDEGGPGFFQDLRFPSGFAAETRLLIDGRPLESPLGPAADLRTLPLAALERVEIHPGASAVGGGAGAGWINLVTRTHLTPQANSGLAFQLASLGREGFSASFGRWIGKRLSLFGTLLFEDAETLTGVASADRSQFWGKARYYVTRRHFVEAAYGTSGATTNSGLTTPVEISPFTGREDRRERRFQALYRGRVGPALVSARYYADLFQERESFTLEGEPQMRGDFRRRGARGSARLGFPGGTAEGGLEWQEDDLDSDAPLFSEEGGASPAPADSIFGTPISRTALFAGAEGSWGDLSLAAQGRLERFADTVEGASEPMLTVDARYAAPHGFQPYLRFGRSARQPFFAEHALLGRAGGPEAVRVSTARELRAGSGWSRGAISAALAAFDRRGKDVAVWLPATRWRSATGGETVRVGTEDSPELEPGEFADLNLLDLRARGVEVRLALPLLYGIRGEAFAQLQSVEDATGRRVPYLAREHALGRLTYEERFFPSRNLRVHASLGSRLSGGRETRTGEELPAYALLDGLLRVQLIGFTFSLSAQNILDLRYRSEERFILPGRIVAFEGSWEFWN